MEQVIFDKGMNKKSSSLVLEDGELQSCSGFVFDSVGDLSTRTPKEKVSTTAVGDIHTLHRYKNYLLLGDGHNARYKWDLDGYCGLYTPANENFTLLGTLSSANRLRMVDCEDFIIMVNGQDSKAFCHGNLYEWNIAAPEAPPSVSVTTGTLNDTYRCYYTYYLKFPNGRTHETGLSPYGSVSPSTQGIIWRNIGICNYVGTDVTITRRLYRTSDSLIDIYFVAEINNNTTTTYTDTSTDATLEASSVVTTEGMSGPPTGLTDIAYYLSRVFGIKGSVLYPGEAYLPFTFDPSNSLQVSPDGIPLECLAPWGDQLYIGTTDKWYRLQGSTATTWAIKQTFAEAGSTNKHSVWSTRFGIITQWYDGIYIFDGSTTHSITKDKIPPSIFTGMTSPELAYATFDGQLYRFFYPSTGTTINSCLTIDMTDYPSMKFYNSDFLPTAMQFHFPTGIYYYGKSGYHYKDGTTETFSASLQTGDKANKDLTHQKELEYLYYDINTGGKDVIVTFYCDGTAQTPVLKINESTRKRDRLTLPKWHAYRYSIKIDCADAKDLHIYGPWFVSANNFGD
jgi:hypothetical protein